MIEVDCLGDICPVPALKLEQALTTCAKTETILLVTDHSCVFDSIRAICKQRGLSYVADEVINGVWEVTIDAVSKAEDQQNVSDTICEKYTDIR